MQVADASVTRWDLSQEVCRQYQQRVGSSSSTYSTFVDIELYFSLYLYRLTFGIIYVPYMYETGQASMGIHHL